MRFDLLALLLRRVDRVVTRRAIEEQVIPGGNANGSNALEVHISNLRRKVGPGFIRTVHGIGYVIYELALAVAEDLADNPERQQHSLAALDRALLFEYGDGEDDGRFSPTMLIWQQALMDSLLRSNQRASRMVAQLLQLMRSETAAADAEPRPLRLDLPLQDRLAALDALACRRPVELDLQACEPLSVRGEREGLVSLIDNLVDNAIKYSPAHSTVSVQLRREGGQAVLQVFDEGPGIAPALRERVFDRFFRVPDQTQSGSGLGLAIARTVAERHGGSIALGAADGGGLPVRVAPPVLSQLCLAAD